jgi:putative phosphoribosyl transferase
MKRPVPERFHNRAEAGRLLAEHLAPCADRSDVLVLGLPRGGVPVAFEIATALHVPMDVLVVRKLPTPDQPELAMGAVALGGIVVKNEQVVRELRIPDAVFRSVVAEQQRELVERERRYRGDRPQPEIRGKVVILVDDGLATGSTMRAAAAAVAKQHPARIIIAIPVAPPWVANTLRLQADEVFCLMTPEPFYAIGPWYEDFDPVSDEHVRRLLLAADDARRRADAARRTDEEELSKS